MSPAPLVTDSQSGSITIETSGSDLRVGMRLGRYELLAPLSSGGMAHVWIAHHAGEHGFQRLVALKTIRPEYADSSALRAMFLDEARIAARIRHANVVEVLDLGEENGVVYQVMTLVEGDSLSGLQHRHRDALPIAVVLRIMIDALAGLHAAHELTDDRGRSLEVVHRDVSPQNILVGVDGSVRIADFGVAKALDRRQAETEAGQMKGKYAYLSPEQIERAPVDRRSDIYSAGIVTWEALTGRRLFVGIDLMETVTKVLAGVVPDPRDFAPWLPDAVVDVVMRALARDRDDRFRTAAAMSDALEAAARAVGEIASSKEVGAFVQSLCGADLARRRERLRSGEVEPVPPSQSEIETNAAVTQTAALGSAVERPRIPPVSLLGPMAFVAVASAVVILLVQERQPTPPKTEITPASASAPATAPPVVASPPAPAAPVAPAATPDPAPAAAPPDIVAAPIDVTAETHTVGSTPPRTTTRTRRAPAPAPPSSARTKYANPYVKKP